MEGLELVIQSFADVDVERALAVARPFDAHPGLRPLKVGGDPARLKVEPSMEALIAKHGLPIDWLTVRRNGRYPDFEGGRIDLFDGRGGYTGTQAADRYSIRKEELGGPNHIGDWVYHLYGHRIQQYWSPETTSEPGAVIEIASLFEDLVLAIDAAYGYVGARLGGVGLHSIERRLPGVFWLNYFGPAFRTTHPMLQGCHGARVLANGGVLVKTADLPTKPLVSTHGRLSRLASWRTDLGGIFGWGAFGFRTPHNPALPSIEAHLAASPGRMEMPWIAHLAKRLEDGKARKYKAARKRLGTLVQDRDEPTLGTDLVDWSTSLDTEVFLDFFAYLKRRLGGELSTPVGTALRAVIANTPLREGDDFVLSTKLGVVRMSWFIDDTDVVDFDICGPKGVDDVCYRWFEDD